MDKVAVVYHFFPHYRGPVLRELTKSESFRYNFFGDIRDIHRSGIEACVNIDPTRFHRTTTRIIFNRFLIQGGLLRLALTSNFGTVIYLGDAQYLMTWLSAALARVRGKRVIFWTHGWLHDETGLKSKVRCAFYRIANALLLYGNRAREIGIAKGFDPRNLFVVYNSLDVEKQAGIRNRISHDDQIRFRERLFADHRTPVAVCTSRLIKPRRIDLLLQAVATLKSNNHEVNILLIGDGPERTFLSQLAENLCVNVMFYGACYDEQILATLLMSASVAVSPGSIGLSVMHSLAYGTPVITHDDRDSQFPEWEAIQPGINGDLFRKGDVDDLARVIRTWTRSPFPTPETTKACVDSLCGHYDPTYQVKVIEAAVRGESPP